LKAEALKMVSKYKLGPVFTPAVVSKPEGPYATLAMATAGGGTNWAGGSYDPETHIAYIPSQRSPTAIGLIPGDPSRTDMMFMSGSAAPRTGSGGGGRRRGPGLTVQGLPLVKPPYGSISAIDLNKGEILWQIANGDTPDNIRDNPALKGLNIPRTGRPGVFGVLVTKTLVICGERSAGKSARDAASLRQGDRQGGRRGPDARRTDRHPDDIHAQREAIHCRRDRGSGIPGRIDRVQAAGRRAQERGGNSAAFCRVAGAGKTFMPPRDYGFSRQFAWVSHRHGVSWQLNFD
jgi:hypothetical protein